MSERQGYPWLDEFEAEELLIASVRYYMGRMTASACSFAENLARAWPQLPKRARDIIQRDLQRQFDSDDMARAVGYSHRPLGMDCDREAWEKVRAAWINNPSLSAPTVDAEHAKNAGIPEAIERKARATLSAAPLLGQICGCCPTGFLEGVEIQAGPPPYLRKK